MKFMHCLAAAGLVMTALASVVRAQEEIPSRVTATWNRYYDYEEMTALLQEIARAYPELVELRSIGKSQEGRDMWLAIVNSPKTGPDTSKPAMYIDGNVHGNEIQAAEMVLYTLWYLTKAYGVNADLTALLDRCAFYTDSLADLPVLEVVGRPVAVNPDPRLKKIALARRWPIEDWGA